MVTVTCLFVIVQAFIMAGHLAWRGEVRLGYWIHSFFTHRG